MGFRVEAQADFKSRLRGIFVKSGNSRNTRVDGNRKTEGRAVGKQRRTVGKKGSDSNCGAGERREMGGAGHFLIYKSTISGVLAISANCARISPSRGFSSDFSSRPASNFSSRFTRIPQVAAFYENPIYSCTHKKRGKVE